MADEFVFASALGARDLQPSVVLTAHGPLRGRRACEGLVPSKVPSLATNLLKAQHKLGGDEICTMMVLSTAHISGATADQLRREVELLPISYPKGGYGWFIYTWVVKDIIYPVDLLQVMLHAWQQGCVWLMLDRDGPVNKNLPTYEW